VHGVLNINKHGGVTSHDIVARVRRILGAKRVGHAGTLDPMATGVLLVCVGHATRIAEYLMAGEKEYVGVMTLGATTDTEDSSGAVTSETSASAITREDVERVIPRFIGVIEQIPPMVSAAHHEGKRLYDLARQGQVVDREARQVEIAEIEMLSFEPGERANATMRVVCSKGVYIRTLFSDIGAALGVGAYMSALTRTRVGLCVLENAINLDMLEQRMAEGSLDGTLVPMAEALADMPMIPLTEAMAEDVKFGRAVQWNESEVPADNLVRLMLGGSLLAVAKIVEAGGIKVIQPVKVFL
jgi:tRNA pseudouridine55 synthase